MHANVPQQLLEDLNRARSREVAKGQVIFYEGDPQLETCIIQDGVIKVHAIDENGDERVLHILGSPDAIPLFSMGRQEEPIEWYYTALTDCRLAVFMKDDFRAMLDNDESVATYFANRLSTTLVEVMELLNSVGKTTVQDRVVSTLHYLLQWHAAGAHSGTWQRINFPVSHQLLADMVGVTRESTAIAMKHLTDAGVVRSPRLSVLEINRNKIEKLLR